MDGEVDYSTFSRAQLEDALSRIDRARYPANFENLMRELAGRPAEVQLSPAEEAAARRARILRWVPAIGITDVVTAALLSIVTLDNLQGLQGAPGTAVAYGLLVIGAVVTANLVGGILTIKRRVTGYWICLWNHALQIVVISIGPLEYRYDGFGSIELFWKQAASFGVYYQWGPGLGATFGGDAPLSVAVDVLAIAFVLMLWRAIQTARPMTANNALERAREG